MNIDYFKDKTLPLSILLLMFIGHIKLQSEFVCGAWVPYWKGEGGIKTALAHASAFQQISPFSFEVNKNGVIRDTLRRNSQIWQSLFDACRQQKAKIIPTIFWTDIHAMHDCFTDEKKCFAHAEQIVDIVLKNKFDGININYERVASADRAAYLTFVKQLAEKLHAHNLLLVCSMGGRTSDNSVALYPWKRYPVKSKGVDTSCLKTVSLHPGFGKEAQEYKHTVATLFDQIHIMGYDEWGVPCKYNKEHLKNEYYLSHASNQWVEKIIQYALSYIQSNKVVLGIPTYGLEFCITPNGDTINFRKRQNISWHDAILLAKKHDKIPKRTAGGELAFTYNNGNELRYVCYLDEVAIQDKINLAKKYNLKGVYFFRLDGTEPEMLWSTISDHCTPQKKPIKSFFSYFW